MSSGIECRRDAEWERKQKDLTTLTDNLVSWEVVRKTPHEVWKTLEGREQMERSLAKLVKAARKNHKGVA